MKNERDKIDDLFKKKLGGYKAQPSQAIWKGIAQKFLNPHLGTISLLNLQNIILIVALVGTGVSAYFLWPSISAEQKPQVPASEEIVLSSSGSATNEIPIETANADKEMKSGTYEQKTGTTDQPGPIETTETESYNNDNLKENEPDIAAENLSSGNDIVSVTAVVENNQSITGKLNNTEDVPLPENNLPAFERTDVPTSADLTEDPLKEGISYSPAVGDKTDSRIQTKLIGIISLNASHKDYFSNIRYHRQPDLPQKPVQWKDDYGMAAQFSAGIYFLPEWINYHNDGKFQSSYSQEILATFQSRNLILRTGLGINRSQDDGNYTANYDKYEQVGYFFGVNYFTGVDGYPDSVIFETYVNEVYDSVNYNESYRTDNAYTYLQIPLQLGYRFISFRGLSLYVVGGPCFSYLLNENEKSPTFEVMEATLISMEDQTPVRRKNNWQLLMGLGAHYSITDRLSFTVEPMYRQFLKSTYSGNASYKPPYSFGIRAGLSYHF